MEILTTGTDDYGHYLKALVCGDPGSGKTLISSTFPNPFYASAEGGMLSVWDRSIKHVKIESSTDLKAVQLLAEQSPDVRKKTVGAPMDTVVIDTIDEIARILIKERTAETHKDALAIADWGWLGDQLRGIIRGFRNLDMHVVFTCHLKSTEDSETGRQFIKPAIQGQVGDEIASYVDLALLLRANTVVRPVDGEAKRVTIRYVQTFPDQNHPWVKDRSGKLPPEFEVNFHDDFDRMYGVIFDEARVVGAAVEGTARIVGDIENSAGPAEELQETETPVSPNEEPSDYKEPASPTLADVPRPDLAVVAPADAPVEHLTEQLAPEPEPEPEGPLPTTRAQLAHMTAKDKMRLDVPVECEECGTVVTNQDQKDMSVVKYRLVLCNVCFKAAKK